MEHAPSYKGPPNSKSQQEDIGEDTHQLVEGKMNEGISEMTEDTGASGDVHQHVQHRMNDMAREMFEED